MPTHKYNVSEVRLDNGGYDSYGSYWGFSRGARLFSYACACGEHMSHLRAPDRNAACAQILTQDSTARFYRGPGKVQ